MTTYFVSRHTGAVQWARRKNLFVNQLVSHLDTRIIQADDTVIGSLPVNLAAQVCAIGARYFHLTLEISPELRGVELSADQLEHLGARLQQFEIKEIK